MQRERERGPEISLDPAAVRDGGAAAVSGAPNDLFRPGDPHYCQLYDRAGGNLKINKKNNQLTHFSFEDNRYICFNSVYTR